uniref:Uncharacterized protein n=1 Tax=Panagrolaimus sp. PS1159 TaxID=55785 RepID=A0AC35F143_9BILA
MEPQRFNQPRKVKIIYINDPGSDKPRPVYVTETSQPNTYQILQNPVIVTSSANDGQMRYMTSSNGSITTAVSSHHYQQQQFQHPQTFISRPPILHPQQQPSTTARRALIPPPPRRSLNPQQPQQFQRLPKLPAPFDFPEIKNFVSSRILPLLSADYVDEYFNEVFGAPPIVGKDFNVETMECPIKPNEQKKAPVIMKRAVQNNRQRLNAAAPYPLLKENRGIRIINPANTATNSGPKIRPAVIRTVRPVKPQTKISQPISEQQPSPSTNNNIPLQVQNPSKP